MIDGVLDLADGRKLAYAEWGSPNAPPLIYCHGFPSNRRELVLLSSALEQSNVNARVVVLNRPGYGPSTFQANRTFLDWPHDVSEVADRLGIDRFGVIGVSGGSPYALACGYALGDRITRIGIVVGIAPVEAPGMEQAAAIRGPSARGPVRRLQFEMAALAFRKGQEGRFIDQSVATMGTPDQEALARPELRDWFTGTMRESFEQGGRAAAHEAGLYRRPWGFDLRQVTTKTRLWYGGADKTVPATAGQWLADRLPNSSYLLWPQHGHFTWMVGNETAAAIGSIVERGSMRRG